MSNENYIASVGTHRFRTYTKTLVTKSNHETYSEEVKGLIVVQYCTLLRDPAFNPTKAQKALGEIHGVHPSSILNWYKKYGQYLSVPVLPKTKKVKTKSKVTPEPKIESDLIQNEKVSVSQDDLVGYATGILSSSSSQSVLTKLTEFINSLPNIEISISVNSNK